MRCDDLFTLFSSFIASSVLGAYGTWTRENQKPGNMINNNNNKPAPTFSLSSSSSSSFSSLPWLPSNVALTKLLVTGATVGPIVDSLHNQCLLEYHKSPISIPYPEGLFAFSGSGSSGEDAFLFCSSWTVPPLLGIAYVVLGGILPRVAQKLLLLAGKPTRTKQKKTRSSNKDSIMTEATTAAAAAVSQSKADDSSASLQARALLAVATTALIIKFSEFLETHQLLPIDDLLLFDTTAAASLNIVILAAAAVLQWAILDGTGYALLVATVAAIGGPLSELPFVAADVWQYLPQAADYFPLQSIMLPSSVRATVTTVLGENYQDLALSSITGPCYFAVTMDAIALGRWFDDEKSSNKANDVGKML